MNDARWMELLTGLEKLRTAVAETEAMVAVGQAHRQPVVEGLREIQRRLVTELRPLVLKKLKELAAIRCEAARDLITVLERNPCLMYGFLKPHTLSRQDRDSTLRLSTLVGIPFQRVELDIS